MRREGDGNCSMIDQAKERRVRYRRKDLARANIRIRRVVEDILKSPALGPLDFDLGYSFFYVLRLAIP